MQTDVLISFIIPAYNAADTIEKAVQSLTDVPRTEVLIVENGSTDETKQVLQRLKKKYSNIKIYLYTPKNYSFSFTNSSLYNKRCYEILIAGFN